MPTPRLDAERHRPLWISLFLIALHLTTMSRAWGSDMVVPEAVASGTMWLYVGTYTHGKTPSEGIYLLELDLASGRLTNKGAVARLADPSFLAIHPEPQVPLRGQRAGRVQRPERGRRQRLAIDPASGRLTLLNQQSSVGSGPCHLTVDRTGKNVLVANYGSGSVACLPIHADGSLGAASSFIQHEGKRRRPLPAGEPARPFDQPRRGPIASPSRPTSASTRSSSTSSMPARGSLDAQRPAVREGRRARARATSPSTPAASSPT